MGDIYPYGGPRYVTWDTAYRYALQAGMPAIDADIAAAIGEAESSLNLAVINDTPATGDYSVGVYQINYFDGLYAGRVKAFGTPRQLVVGGIIPQTHAMYELWRASGFTPWSTYKSGAYRQYLHGKVPPGPRPGPNPVGVGQQPAVTASDSWGTQVLQSSAQFRKAALLSAKYGKYITSTYVTGR